MMSSANFVWVRKVTAQLRHGAAHTRHGTHFEYFHTRHGTDTVTVRPGPCRNFNKVIRKLLLDSLEKKWYWITIRFPDSLSCAFDKDTCSWNASRFWYVRPSSNHMDNLDNIYRSGMSAKDKWLVNYLKSFRKFSIYYCWLTAHNGQCHQLTTIWSS